MKGRVTKDTQNTHGAKKLATTHPHAPTHHIHLTTLHRSDFEAGRKLLLLLLCGVSISDIHDIHFPFTIISLTFHLIRSTQANTPSFPLALSLTPISNMPVDRLYTPTTNELNEAIDEFLYKASLYQAL